VLLTSDDTHYVSETVAWLGLLSLRKAASGKSNNAKPQKSKERKKANYFDPIPYFG
jgi:hypothetical protein